MKKQNLILYILTVVTLSSCIQLKVKKNYRNYSPYEVNDVLIFQSLKNKISDTFFIYKIAIEKVPDWCKPKTKNAKRYVCRAFSSHILDYGVFLKEKYANSHQPLQLYEIIPKYRYKGVTCNDNGIQFNAHFPDLFSVQHFITFKEYNKAKEIKLVVNGITYNDVIELTPTFKYGINYDRLVTKFYWSKTFGYLKLITHGGDIIINKNKYNAPEVVKKMFDEEQRKKAERRKDYEKSKIRLLNK